MIGFLKLKKDTIVLCKLHITSVETGINATKLSCLIAGLWMFLVVSKKADAQLTYSTLRVEYDSAWTFKNLQIIPVKFKGGAAMPTAISSNNTNLITVAEALQKHKIKLQEMQYENGADVNWLQVSNHSKQDVIIQSGEILDGGKQDRMVGETKIIAAGSTDYLHVFCVEKRRWADKPKGFTTAGVANSELQKTMNMKGRQSEVWKEIDRQFSTSDKKSETVSYVDLYKNTEQDDSDYIRFFLSKYGNTDSNFAGFIFITGNKIMSTELYASSNLTNIAFRNLLSTYVSSARRNGASPTVNLEKEKTFMDKVLTDETSQKVYISTHGKLQISNGKVIHLVAYDD